MQVQMAASMKIPKTKQRMYCHWFFAGFSSSYGDTVWAHYNYDDYKVKICTLFYFKVEQLTKKTFNYRKYLNILTKLCHYCLSGDINFVYALPKEVSTTWEKNTFLRCEDLTVCWDLKLKIYYCLHVLSYVSFWNIMEDKSKIGF